MRMTWLACAALFVGCRGKPQTIEQALAQADASAPLARAERDDVACVATAADVLNLRRGPTGWRVVATTRHEPLKPVWASITIHGKGCVLGYAPELKVEPFKLTPDAIAPGRISEDDRAAAIADMAKKLEPYVRLLDPTIDETPMFGAAAAGVRAMQLARDAFVMNPD